MRRANYVIPAVLAAGLLAAGCSSDSKPSAAGSAPATVTTSKTATATATATKSATQSTTSTPKTSSATSSAPKPVGPAGGAVPAGFKPYSATFVGTSTGWVLGTAPCAKAPCTSIVRTRNGGASWQGIPAPKAAIADLGDLNGNGTVSIVRFANTTDGWVAGNALYSTHDGGATWQAVPGVVPDGETITGMETGNGVVYVNTTCAQGSAGDCAPTVSMYASPISSDHFTQVAKVQTGSNASTSGLVVRNGSWYLPTAEKIVVGSGTSTATRTISSPKCATGADSRIRPRIAVSDAQHLDAMCVSSGGMGSAGYQLYGTSDGGAHWVKNGPSHTELSGLYGLADNQHGVLLVAVASAASDILRTTDDGKTLTQNRLNTTAGGASWSDLGFTNTNRAIAVLDKTALFISTDAGAHFTAAKF